MEYPPNQPINKQIFEHPAKEQEPLSKLDNTLGQIDSAIKDLDVANLTPEQDSRLRQIKGKIIESTGKFLRVTRRAVAIGVIIGSALITGGIATAAIGYEINHPVLEQTIDANGQTIYTHPDERTNHYLNILAGRDKFTEGDMKYAVKYSDQSDNYYTAHYYNALAGLEAFTVDDPIYPNREDYLRVFAEMQKKGTFFSADEDLNQYLVQPMLASLDVFASDYDGPFFTKDDVKKMNEDVFKSRKILFTERSPADNRDVYNLVWQLEKEAGNPLIRLTKDRTDRFKELSDVHYAAASNTVQIRLNSLIIGNNSKLISEMSHAKQYEDRPADFLLRSARDGLEVFTQSVLSRKGFREVYDELLYDKPGSIEYEAHRVIQPDLEKKYPIKITSSKNMEKHIKNLRY